MNYHTKNRELLLSKIEDRSMVLLTSGSFIKKSADESYPFSVNPNFYYLTGVDEASVMLLMVKTKTISIQQLYIAKADHMMEKWVGKTISSEEAQAKSQIKDILYIDDLNEQINKLISEHKIQNIYIDDEENDLFSLGRNLLKKYPKLQELKLVDVYPLIIKQRAIKSDEEVEALKEAIKVTDKGIMNMLGHMHSGIYENQLEAYFDHTLKDHNMKPAFTTIAAGGVRATTLHYVSNDQKINDNELVLFDLGAMHDHYCADISRTFPVNGRFTQRQRLIYEIVLKAQQNVIDAVRPNVTLSDLQRITVKTYQKELKKIGLIKEGTEEEVRKYYYHGVSHSLGLNTHDVGVERDEPLQAGMVITVEPGLYIEDEAIGIRIEDDVLVTDDKAVVLSDMIIKEIEDIENYFKNRNCK
jgi:Xaa-Pro aminopeptidase